MALEGKITVKHYLNKKLRPLLRKGKKTYPLYLRASFKNKFTEFKSRSYLFTGSTGPGKIPTVDELTQFLNVPTTFNLEDVKDIVRYYTDAEFENVKNSAPLTKEQETIYDVIDVHRREGINVLAGNAQETINKCLTSIDDWLAEEMKRSLQQTIGRHKKFELLSEIIDWASTPYLFVYSALSAVAGKEFQTAVLDKHSADAELLTAIKKFSASKNEKLWIYKWKYGTLKSEIISFLSPNPNSKNVIASIDALYKQKFIQ